MNGTQRMADDVESAELEESQTSANCEEAFRNQRRVVIAPLVSRQLRVRTVHPRIGFNSLMAPNGM